MFVLPAAFAGDSQAPEALYDTTWLDKRYDWSMTLDAQTLPAYLAYKDSKLKPVVNARVFCRVNPRLSNKNNNVPSGTVQYEDLIYSVGRPIGCRHQLAALPFMKGWQGAITVSPSVDAQTQSSAIANAIVRLLLEIDLQSDQLAAVLVPESLIGQLVNDLGRFNFFNQKYCKRAQTGIYFIVTSGDPKNIVTMVYAP